MSYDRIKFNSGVIFATYSSLVSSMKAKGQGKNKKVGKSRLMQLLEWCGGGKTFDGCILFDECHRAKNLKWSSNNNKSKTSSKTALAVFELQKALPNARVVYCSATGITSPSGFTYRLTYILRNYF
jgi:hypothetical protein